MALHWILESGYTATNQILDEDDGYIMSEPVFSYPMPQLTPGTLRVAGGSAVLNDEGTASHVTLENRAASTEVKFNGLHFGEFPDAVSISYTSAEGYMYSCEVSEVLHDEITCSTAGAEPTTDFLFTVDVGGQQSEQGLDELILECIPSEVMYSDKSDTGAISGGLGDTVYVQCDSGYSGSGTATCGANGTFLGLPVCTGIYTYK